ncbi:hypothetical protein TNCT_699251 [Trichonephila clavata]|uniref:DNA replication ATP-dependent helicase/nuclease DNA2 n=1 Tax=Trichonephila clavata TaxID=2740835 RepID=A0A8X6K9N9_TRICU|nr:hypothetical protein TNCT_699251 [Trichonephila clavata]
MDQFSDDDFVPPTPKNQRKLLLLQEVSQNSKLSTKATSKNFKKPIQNAKRKKTSGISPDFKKFKDKTKQVTLFNYLKKDASSKEISIDHPAKVRLFTESKSTDVKNTAHVLVNCLSETTSNLSTCASFSDPENELNNGMFIEDDIDPKIKTITLSESCSSSAKISIVKCVDFVKDSFAVQQLNTDSEFSMNLNNLSNTPSTLKISEIAETNTKNEFQNNISEACLYSNEICKDVENLKLHLDERIKCTDYSLSNKVLLEVQEHEKEANKVDVTFNENNANVSDMESSISWINDFDWKAYDNSMEKDVSVSKDTSKSKISNFLENKLLFTVKEICKNEMNEPKLILETISGDLKTCILKGFWTDSLVNVGDSVHVLKEFENNQAVIDNHSGFLVINPDFLLSSTAIVSTLFCMRKAALNHILPSWSSGNDVMMIGNLVHDIFQQAVNNHASSKEEINTIFERVFMKRENLISLSCQDTIESELKEKVAEYIPSITKWIEKHCTFGKRIAVDNLQVTSVEGIEDNVWSPKYGVKGKIDMTVKTFFRKKQISKILPLELKTGRATYSAEHIGQINLYILMLEENSKELSEGLLLYLRDIANMKLVSVNHNSLRGLIQLRNELAFYTSRWISRSSTQIDDIENCHLPKPLNNKKFCGKCPYLLPCTVYQRALSEDKDLEVDHAMKSLITPTTSHLKHSHLQYFVHWSNLLLIESSNVAITNAFWTEESTSREKKGMCLSWLSLDKNAKQNKEINETFSATFCRSAKSPITSSLASVGLKTGDYIAVSKQGSIDEVAITMGYIVKILEESVTIISDRDFSKVSKYEDYIFRIDKQISNSATACIRNNLMCLMNNDSEALELRKFVIDKHPPSLQNLFPKM